MSIGHKSVTVQSGPFAGEEYRLEGTLEEVWQRPVTLIDLYLEGNAAAVVAINARGYQAQDAPFYYGKIGNFGHILCHRELYG